MHVPQRYQLEKDMESGTLQSRSWLKERIKEVLESTKEVSKKCDYLGYSLLSFDAKIETIDEEIKELRSIKERLRVAKEISLDVGAELFSEYGIQKLEGAGISSITLYQPPLTSKLTLSIINEEPLIHAGFFKRVIDVDAIKEAYLSGMYHDLLKAHCTLEEHQTTPTVRLKINKRRVKSTELEKEAS